VIATGYRNQADVIPGLEVANAAYTITTLEDAIHAGEGWRRFIQDPGPVVVGATQGAGCFGAAHEFLFNLSYQLKRPGCASRSRSPTSPPSRSLATSASAGFPAARPYSACYSRRKASRPSPAPP
jgi:hypothetical protein